MTTTQPTRIEWTGGIQVHHPIKPRPAKVSGKYLGLTESIMQKRDERDLDTISVYECGSVLFLEGLAHLPHWEEDGVPISGDKTATFPWRAER